MLFFTFPPIERALKDPRHHSSLVQPWPSEPVFDQLPCFLSKQRATGGNCVYRAERRSQEPCEVSRPQRHMFGISASIRIEHSRYTLKEPNPYRPKQKHAHISI